MEISNLRVPISYFRFLVSWCLGGEKTLSISLLVIIGLLTACHVPPPPQWKPLDASTLPTPLPLSACLELARTNDVRSAQWKAKLEAARAEIGEAKALPNPTANLTWEDVGVRDALGHHLAQATYGVSYPIFFWWPRSQKITQAEAGRRVVEQTIRSERRELAIQIGSAFFNLVADQRKEKLSEELLKASQESLRLAEKEKSLKTFSDYDVDRARAEAIKGEDDLAEARNQLRLDQLAFAFALGADRPIFPQVADAPETDSLTLRDAPTDGTMPDDFIASALEADPDYQRAQNATRAAEAKLIAEQRSAIPLTESTANAGPRTGPEGKSGVFGLDVPLPIFNWNRWGIRKAREELKVAQAEEEEARRSALAKLSEAWERRLAAEAKWKRFAKPLAELSKKNEDSACKLFSAGQISYSDFLLVRRDSKQAQLGEVAAHRDWLTAEWALSCLFGKQDTEFR